MIFLCFASLITHVTASPRHTPCRNVRRVEHAILLPLLSPLTMHCSADFYAFSHRHCDARQTTKCLIPTPLPPPPRLGQFSAARARVNDPGTCESSNVLCCIAGARSSTAYVSLAQINMSSAYCGGTSNEGATIRCYWHFFCALFEKYLSTKFLLVSERRSQRRASADDFACPMCISIEDPAKSH